MENIEIEKKCPFCPDKPYSHVYKTYRGLYRHIWNWHVFNSKSHSRWPIEDKSNPDNIRVYEIKFSKYYDIPINGEAHVNALIEAYCKEKYNPSLRNIEERKE